MEIDYATAKYKIRDAAKASGLPLNTLRSLYGREHFRIVGGEDKKGRGMAADLTLPDVMCIGVAKALIDVGAHPRVAFDAGYDFAYRSNEKNADGTLRLPAQTFKTGFTVLVAHPTAAHAKIINTDGDAGLSFTDLFHVQAVAGRHAGLVLLVNDVERAVLANLNA